MATYHDSIILKPSEAALIRDLTENEPKSEDEAFIDSTIVYTAHYDNGYEMDVKCCGVLSYEPDGVNTAWCEAVLFDESGCQVSFTDVEETFFGDWSLCDHDGNEYVAHVIELKED